MEKYDAKDHELVRLTSDAVRRFIARAFDHDDPSHPQVKKGTPQEERAVEVFIALGEVLSAREQLFFASQLLTSYRKALAPPGMNRYQYIIYSLENYFIRHSMMYDRCLKLINTVYNLGLPERDCRTSSIVQNKHVKDTPTAAALTRIGKAVERYRSDRNMIMHAKTLFDAELQPVGFFELLTESGVELGSRLADFSKRFADEYVAEKKKEFQEEIAELDILLADLFGTLLPRVEIELAQASTQQL